MSTNANTFTWRIYPDTSTTANSCYSFPHTIVVGGECVVCHKTAQHKAGDMWVHPRCFYEVKHIYALAEVEIPYRMLRKMLSKEGLEKTILSFMNDRNEFDKLRDKHHEEAVKEFVEAHPLRCRE